MSDDRADDLTRWLQERVPSASVHTERDDQGVRFLVGEGDERGELRVPTALLRDDGDAPPQEELHRALQSANAAALLAKGRTLALKGDPEQELKKVWLEDAADDGG